VAEDESQSSGPSVSDAVQACIRMTGAGIAIAVLPYALATGVAVAADRQATGHVLGTDDLTGTARVLLLCTLVAGAGVLAAGVRAAWRVRAMRGGGPRIWLAVVAATLAAWCWPPLWFLTTPWMFVGATLAVRPLWWSQRVWGEVTAEDAQDHRRMAFALTVVVTLLAHVMTWLLVVATAPIVPAAHFARVEAIRRGEAVASRDGDREPASVATARLDMLMPGATAAGRLVGGDVTRWNTAIGPWPLFAQRWIVRGAEGPTSRESWTIAGLAFLASMVFWTPLMLAWTSFGLPDPRRLPPGGESGLPLP
jgi:hypothetical protein